MAQNKLEKRRALFRTLSANLNLFDPSEVPIVRCPICGLAGGADAVETDTLTMDLAHVYPIAAGGRRSLATLTCCRCNSRIGRLFDHHLAAEKELHDALGGSGKSEIGAVCKIAGAEIRGTFKYSTATGGEFCVVKK